MKKTSKESIIAKLLKNVDEREHMCFTCYKVENPNWLAYLQDCLEDEGASVQDFCKASGRMFYLERNRLRVDPQTCPCILFIKDFLDKM